MARTKQDSAEFALNLNGLAIARFLSYKFIKQDEPGWK